MSHSEINADVDRSLWMVVPAAGELANVKERAAWALALEKKMIARGTEPGHARTVVSQPTLQQSPAANVRRLLFVAKGELPLGFIDMYVTAPEPQWRETVMETASHPVALVRDPQFDDFDAANVRDGIEAIRFQETEESAVVAVLVLAGIIDGRLVMARGEARDLVTFAQMREAARELFATVTLAPVVTSA